MCHTSGRLTQTFGTINNFGDIVRRRTGANLHSAERTARIRMVSITIRAHWCTTGRNTWYYTRPACVPQGVSHRGISRPRRPSIIEFKSHYKNIKILSCRARPFGSVVLGFGSGRHFAKTWPPKKNKMMICMISGARNHWIPYMNHIIGRAEKVPRSQNPRFCALPVM